MFQFLTRNSVRWDLQQKVLQILTPQVSIPQSEFCPLGLDTAALRRIMKILFQFLSRNSVRWDETKRGVVLNDAYVSIPQSEFCPLGQVLEGAHKSSS